MSLYSSLLSKWFIWG